MTPKLTTTIEWFDAVTDPPKEKGDYLAYARNSYWPEEFPEACRARFDPDVEESEHIRKWEISHFQVTGYEPEFESLAVILWAHLPKIEIPEPIPYETNS